MPALFLANRESRAAESGLATCGVSSMFLAGWSLSSISVVARSLRTICFGSCRGDRAGVVQAAGRVGSSCGTPRFHSTFGTPRFHSTFGSGSTSNTQIGDGSEVISFAAAGVRQRH